MPQARTQHPNASLTPSGRLKIVLLVVDHGWTIEAAAERFQIDAKTVRKWRDRYLAKGEAGLFDRSSRPHHSRTRHRSRVGVASSNCASYAAGLLPTSATKSAAPARPSRRSSSPRGSVVSTLVIVPSRSGQQWSERELTEPSLTKRRLTSRRRRSVPVLLDESVTDQFDRDGVLADPMTSGDPPQRQALVDRCS